MESKPYYYKDLTDEVLFNRYAGGDMAAFDVLLRRHKGLIYSLILRYVKSATIADEIFQEVFLKICKYKDQFRESISFKSWMVTICRNTCIDHLRHVKRSLETESLDADVRGGNHSLNERVASADPIASDYLAIRLETEEMGGYLEKLPLEQKEAFYLKVVMDMTFEEIGAVKKCSVNTVKSRYRYALETLRGLVNRQRLIRKAAFK